jgi:23S rRNA (pseudouridine1915-N3)-methyltransferase
MQIKILWVGKTKNAAIKSLWTEYLERLRHLVSCEIVEIRDLSKVRGLRGARLRSAEGAVLEEALSAKSRLVVLDAKGKEFSSEEFARWFQNEQVRGVSEIDFIIGGAEGICDALLRRAHLTFSLGKLTWTHEMVRVLLLEQIYRAFCILRNIPYHRGERG